VPLTEGLPLQENNTRLRQKGKEAAFRGGVSKSYSGVADEGRKRCTRGITSWNAEQGKDTTRIREGADAPRLQKKL